MKHAKNRFLMLTSALALAALVACDGSSKVGEVGSDAQPTLLTVETGRLVDVYAYRRVDPNIGDRRQRTNRRLDLVAANVLINGNIESQSLFDAAGNAVASANFEFLPFDKAIGHEELVILWDDRPGPEQQNFKTAFTVAQAGLGQVPASYRGQNTATRPIPIVARNAAIKLTFSGKVDSDPAFFAANPAVIQLLEFKGDPAVVEPTDAFRILPYRIVTSGNTIILDTTILAGETAGSTTPGLPLSVDNQTANIRIAIPSRGAAVSTFYVKEDAVLELNDIDSAGRNSVIRDFRSGNLADGPAGRMREPEAPMIVSPLAMGIVDVDAANNIITLNKRAQLVPVRARYPFVDGPLGADGIPRGPSASPVQQVLKFGDTLQQTIQVEVLPGQFEAVTLRAEVLENLAIFSTVGDPSIGLVDPAATPAPPAGNDSGQGETVPVVRVRVASVFAGTDSTGTLQSFRANTLPAGQDCTLRARYYEENPFATSAAVLSDRDWRSLFVRIDPKPDQAAVDVQPNASVAVEFTKPMDLDQVDPASNLLLTSLPPTGNETFEQQMGDPKAATQRVVVARLTDLSGDGTVLRLQPPIGFFHNAAAAAPANAERYRINVRLGTAGVTDLAGTPLEVFANPASPLDAWTVDFSLAPTAPSNLVGWHQYIFDSEDEDGTLPGSADFFGQYRLENGRLTAAATVRFGRSADQQNLQAISRITRGECWDGRATIPNPAVPPVPPTIPNPNANTTVPPVAPPQPPLPFRVPLDQNVVPHTGNLYWDPQMSATVAPPAVPQVFEFFQQVSQPVGRVIEPLKPQGSRMQMRYIEDDFSLSYRQPSEFAVDVERLYWSPFNDEFVLFDVFDRVTMSLAHAKRRPDEYWTFALPPLRCKMHCASMNSALSTVFAENVLDGSSLVPVFEDKVYAINPNEAFRTTENTKFVPFPRFDRTYTWRDSRLVTIDASGNVIGLGGAQDPAALSPADDRTAKIDSPWVTSVPVELAWPSLPANQDPDFFALGNTTWVEDPADFRGEAARDHDPIALPLLVDFKVFADDQANGLAIAGNGFQMAMLGPISYGVAPYGGYYDNVPAGCFAAQPRWPSVRVHASGGFDTVTGQEFTIDPANVLSTTGNVVKDAGALAFAGGSPITGLFPAPARDGMLNWARADFVRKQSTVTFGFFDTQRPQFSAVPLVAGVPNGIPDLTFNANSLRINDLVVQMDPPQARQPGGTQVVVEVRGAEDFTNSGELYDPLTNDIVDLSPATPGTYPANNRKNLLNANYACEAYRYSTPNGSLNGTLFDTPRVAAPGLTRYVTEDDIGLIRDPATGLLPRFLNVRVVMTNNIDVSPALSPSLRSLGIVYRMQASQ